MKKTLYINGRFLLSPQSGVERFAFELCKALTKLGILFYIVCPKNGVINDSYDITKFNIIRYGIGNSHFWEQIILPTFFINKTNYIVISLTGLGSILLRNKVMTIHDLSFLENPAWFSKLYYIYYRIMTPLAAYTSKELITVSNFSRNEILKHYNFIKKEKIQVIYNATSAIFTRGNDIRTDKNEDTYFLAVSSLDPRKNFSRLIKAFESLPSIKLKVVGGKSHVHALTTAVSNKNIEFMGRVTDQELAKLYKQAKAFIYPSLYEGFGIPPIEAMTTGCPVLASAIPAHKEICGNSVIYFDPLSIDSIKNAINFFNSLNNEEIDKIVKKGYENANKYSWESSAKKLYNILCNY